MAEGTEAAIPEAFQDEFRDGRWLSYEELGKIRGIGRPSAVKLAQREKWPRRLGIDWTARVLVPLEWLKLAKPLPEDFPEVAGPTLGQSSGKQCKSSPRPSPRKQRPSAPITRGSLGRLRPQFEP